MAGKQVYLFTFNVVSLIGWFGVLTRILVAAEGGGLEAAYRASRARVELMQYLALLEIAHAALRITRGNVASAIMQNLGRDLVLFGVLSALPAAHAAAAKDTAWVGALFATWAASEVCRFPFYAGAIVAGDATPAPAWLRALKWVRYSAFVPLYPLGFAAEVMVLWRALPAIEAANLHGWLVPGFVPWGFRALLLPYMAYAYGVGAPKLYLYMLKQRRRQLGGAAAKTKNGD